MTIRGADRGKTRARGHDLMTQLEGKQTQLYAVPFGLAQPSEGNECVWYLADDHRTALVLLFPRYEGERQQPPLACITFLGSLHQSSFEAEIRTLVVELLKDARDFQQTILVRTPEERRSFFSQLGFITLCTFVQTAETRFSLMVFPAEGTSQQQLVQLRNADGNNPRLLKLAYRCGALRCSKFGHYLCKRCRSEVFCSPECYEKHRMEHMRLGCKPPEHLVKTLFD